MTKLSPAHYVFVFVVAVTTSVLVHTLWPTKPLSANGSAEPDVFQRVTEKGVLRCGYVTYPPGCIKDPNSGELSGIFVDAIEESASNLGLKVEWTEEVGWGSMIEGLKADRYDLIGSPVWANSSRAKMADFTTPLFYSGICMYVRSDDSRFDRDISKADSPDVSIATIDGEMSAIIAQGQFSKAKPVSLPQLSDNSQMLLNVVQGRADVTFVEPYIAELFLKNSPGTLKNVTPTKPLRVYPNCMMLRSGQPKLKAMLDVALQEALNSGRISKLFEEYRIPAGSFYLPASPYSNPVGSVHSE